jgi:hypothetical protein
MVEYTPVVSATRPAKPDSAVGRTVYHAPMLVVSAVAH